MFSQLSSMRPLRSWAQPCMLAVLSLLLTSAAHAADDMPPPQKAPRIKVQQQKLTVDESRGNRVVAGQTRALEAEKLKVGDTELRLFGIVMPQQAAAHGVAARAALEQVLAAGSVSCRIQQRDKNWRLLGVCRTDAIADIGLMLLQNGWAIVARGTVQQSDYADVYLAAEAKAQLQKLGMWAQAEASAAAPASAPNAALPAGTLPDVTLPVSAAADSPPATSQSAPATETKPVTAGVSPTKVALPALARPVVAGVAAMPTAEALAAVTPPIVYQQVAAEPSSGILWFAALTPMAVMILFALGQIALRYYEYQQERKALAAALRGELLAARAICVSRADTLGHGAEASAKLSTLWPRLRSTVFQAYVGRIGLLGPDLARRVASLYGQFNDYAQFYTVRPQADAAGKIDAATVQQTLFTIIDHIEDTLSNLQQVETTGNSLTRFIARRTGSAAPTERLMPKKPKAEPMHYVDAEIVPEERAALKAIAAEKTPAPPTPAAPATTNGAPAAPVAPTVSLPAEVMTVLEPVMPLGATAESAAAEAAVAVAPAAIPLAPATTLALMTAAHEAIDQGLPPPAAVLPLNGNENVNAAVTVPPVATVSNAAPTGKRGATKNKADSAADKPVTGTALATLPLLGAKVPNADDKSDDYYDFRDQALKLSKQ
jgi:endonuclease YncB( thermonuclease family)